MAPFERLTKLFTDLGLLKPKEVRPPVISSESSTTVAPPGQAKPAEKTPHAEARHGRIGLKIHGKDVSSGASPEVPESQKDLRARVDARAKDQPISNRLEILVEEAGPDVNPQIAKEVKQLAATLREAPSREQWGHIQESLGRISNIPDVKTSIDAKILQREVRQYSFYQVVTHAPEYGLTKSDAPIVVETFRGASIDRHQELQVQIPEQAPPSDVQNVFEKALADAERMRAPQVGRMSKEEKEEKEAEEREKKEEKRREVKEKLKSDTEKREHLDTIEEVKEYVNETLVEITDPALRDFLVRNPIQSKAVLEFLGKRLRAGQNLMQASRELAFVYMSPNPPFTPQESIEIRRLFAHLETATGPLGLMEIQGGAGPRKTKAGSSSSRPENRPRVVDVGGSKKERDWWLEWNYNGKPSLYYYGKEGGNIQFGKIPHGPGSPYKDIHDILQRMEGGIRLDSSYIGGVNHLQDYSEFVAKFEALDKTTTPPKIIEQIDSYRKSMAYLLQARAEGLTGYMGLGVDIRDVEAIHTTSLTEQVRDRIRTIEKETRSYEQQDAAAAAAARSAEYMVQYSQSTQYESDVKKWYLLHPEDVNTTKVPNLKNLLKKVTSKPFSKMTQAERADAYVKYVLNIERSAIAKELGLRRRLVDAGIAYNSQGMTLDVLAKIMSPIGDEGLQYLRGLYDGAVGDVVDFFDMVNDNGRYLRHGSNRRWVNETVFGELKNKVTKDLPHLKRLLQKKLAQNGSEITQNQYEEIIRIADKLSSLTQRRAVWMSRGLSAMEGGSLGPGENPNLQHAYGAGGGSSTENLVGMLQIWRFKILRWALYDKAPLSVYESACRLAAKAAHGEEIVKARIDKALENNGARLEELVKDICFINEGDAPATVTNRLQRVFHNFGPKGEKDFPQPTTVPEAMAIIAQNPERLKDAMMVQLGGALVDRSLMVYTFYDSGPMYTEVISQITGMFREDLAKTLGINMRVRAAYANVVGAQTHDNRHAAQQGLKVELESAALYNPLELLKTQIDHGELAIKDWVRGLNVNRVKKFLNRTELREGIVNAHGEVAAGDLVGVVGERVLYIDKLIQDELKLHIHGSASDLTRIDWRTGPQGRQIEIVKTALRDFRDLPDTATNAQMGYNEFVQLMKDMSIRVAGSGQQIVVGGIVQHDINGNVLYNSSLLDEMTKARYWDFGYQTVGVYDSFLDLLDDPKRFGDKPGCDSMPAFWARTGGHEGRGSGSLSVRAPNDANTASKAIDGLIQAGMTMDLQTFAKLAGDIAHTGRFVYGAGWDARPVLYTLGGLMDIGGLDALNEWSFGFLDMVLPKNSPYRRLLNSEHAISMSLAERWKFKGEIENILARGLEEIDQDIAEEFIKHVRLNFGPFEGEDSGIWAKRASVALAIGLVLTVGGLTKEAGDGLSESGAGVGGGGGGGGHAGGH